MKYILYIFIYKLCEIDQLFVVFDQTMMTTMMVMLINHRKRIRESIKIDNNISNNNNNNHNMITK